jgi:hypothetical protein
MTHAVLVPTTMRRAVLPTTIPFWLERTSRR